MNERNPLKDSTKPLFFKLASVSASNIGTAPTQLADSVRTHVRSLSLMQKEALVASSRTGAVWRLASDEGAYLNGDDEAPCPLSFLTVGMISSTMEEILALASRRGISIEKIRLIQDNYYTMKGSALQGTMTGGAKDIELDVQIESDASTQAIVGLVSDAIAARPLEALLQASLESTFSLTHNAKALDCARVATTGGAPVASLADELYEAAAPDAGDWTSVIIRNGPTPLGHSSSATAGSSLKEQQDRTLHVRGICTLRSDGVKQIEQHLYNPPGSIFHFLSDEAPINGGQGLAPDAATYISAGIAFCFMTQIGRYATISKRTLNDYRIVQDTQFSLGGASGGTREGGRASGVETHLHLATNESDAFAQSALDMGEQTCFLHALCRTSLKTNVRIRDYQD